MLTTKNDEFLNTEIESDWYSKFPKDFTKFDLSLIFNIIVIYLSIKFIDNLFRNLFSLKKKIRYISNFVCKSLKYFF